MRSSRKASIGLAAAVSLLISNWDLAMSADRLKNDTLSVPSFRGASLSQDPVDIQIGGAHLRIPRNLLEAAVLYKSYLDTTNYTNAVGLTIVTTFPEFTGATEDTIHCYKPLGACPSKLITLYSLGSTQADISGRLAPAVAAAAKSENVDQLGLVKVDVQVSAVPNDIYVSYGGAIDKSVVMECSRQDVREPNHYCRVYLKFHEIPMLYQYDRALLPHWSSIHNAMTQMLETFFVEEVQ
jgi:hypothetical protein